MCICNIGRTLDSVNTAYPGAKHAVHGVGEALCTFGAVWIVCVQQPKWRLYQQAPFFMVMTFVAITFISDPNCTEWFHKAA